MYASLQVGTMELRIIGKSMYRFPNGFLNPKQLYQPIPHSNNEVASVIASVEPLLNDVTLWDQLDKKVELSKFKLLIGSTHFVDNEYLVSDDETYNTYISTY